MVLLEIFGKACMFYNVRLFLYTKLHVEMCLINFGIRYECKIGVRFVKEFNDTIRQNPFCRRIPILTHKLRIEEMSHEDPGANENTHQERISSHFACLLLLLS